MFFNNLRVLNLIGKMCLFLMSMCEKKFNSFAHILPDAARLRHGFGRHYTILMEDPLNSEIGKKPDYIKESPVITHAYA